jgi:hypothetical protein
MALLLAALLATVSPSTVRGNPPAEPLPAGAIARFGPGGMWHGSAVESLAFAADGKTLVSVGDATARVAKLHKSPLTGDALRQHRAICVLERLATPAARELLRRLATGAAGARQPREAAAALERMKG